MIFYIVLLVIAVLITVALAWGIVHFTHILKRNEAKKAATFFIPSILAVFLILHIYYALLPVFLDAPQLLSGNRELRSMTFASRHVAWVVDENNGEVYYYDPFSMKLKTDVPYLVAYGKNSHFIVEANPLDEIARENSSSEDVKGDTTSEKADELTETK